MNWSSIDYGIVGAVMLALLSLFAWVLKKVLNDLTEARAAARTAEFADIAHRLEETKNVVISKGEELLNRLAERCTACSYDHDKMTDGITSLSASISQLIVVVKYVLDTQKEVVDGRK